jgi:hypothetical protein
MSTFDFNKLFGNRKNVSVNLNNDILKKAALMFDFNTSTDFPGYSNTEVQLLESMANRKLDGTYFLGDKLRSTILLNEIGVDNISQSAKKLGVENKYVSVMHKVLQEGKVKYEELDDEELYYLNRLTAVFDNELDKNEIEYELGRRYFLAPFRNNTQNFAGRTIELHQINDYVDWLPKEGLLNILGSFVRNVINWHDKPPMLIQGVGGIGKSTLISKVILDNNDKGSGRQLPFIYIDFDLPGFSFSEPLSILLEGIRQLSLQFPGQREIFQRISEQISNVVGSEDETGSGRHISSSNSQRGIVYSLIGELIDKYTLELSGIKFPVLVVFDSFEEIQYRATREEMDNFFTFIREISERVPRIRPIFVGRAEISETMDDFEFQNVILKEFDQESAEVILKKFKVSEVSVRRKIYDTFGGNPLVLRLAAALVQKDADAINDNQQAQGAKQEYLVNRILEHVHDPDVRKIAVPGMLLRRITPDIIRRVLAKPCGLGQISSKKAQTIFEALSAEVALIVVSTGSDAIVFRQDLRLACESIIRNKHPEETKMIYDSAIDYYRERFKEGIEYQVEYYFILLKTGRNLDSLTREIFLSLRSQLESSITEFPEASQLHIKSLQGAKIQERVIKVSNDQEWSRYYLPQIRQGLNSDFEFLKKIDSEIRRRKFDPIRVVPEFMVYYLILKQRLNRLSESNETIQSYLSKRPMRDHIATQLLFILAQNLEYLGNYEEALRTCIQYQESVSRTGAFELEAQKGMILLSRLRDRLGLSRDYQVHFPESFRKSKLESDFIDVNWLVFVRMKHDIKFVDFRVFDAARARLAKRVGSFMDLDRESFRMMNCYLKDITLGGDLKIVMIDYLYALEARGKFIL